MKDAVRGKRYVSDEEVKTTVRNRLHQQPSKFYEAGIDELIPRWNTAIERGYDFLKHRI